jgi:hypothetical protein
MSLRADPENAHNRAGALDQNKATIASATP